MRQTLRSAILKTILYADIFDYPLTEKEVWYFLIQYPQVTPIQCKQQLKKMSSLQNKENLYFLKNRAQIVSTRKKRALYSKEKNKRAKKISNVLKHIPTIKFIGITGGLAVNNVEKDDDIDLYIITTKNAVWTTRLMAVILLDIWGRRRKPNAQKLENKVCLNMFVDEDHMKVSTDEQDLYTAHEVVQMRPIYDSAGVYKKFRIENAWIKKYLPNAFPKNETYKKVNSTRNKKQKIPFVESILMKLQLWYMKKRRTTEVIKNGMLRFHPHDAREHILRLWQDRHSKLPS